jgi:isoquinoline 1-oxidoreductase beta subunit
MNCVIRSTPTAARCGTASSCTPATSTRLAGDVRPQAEQVKINMLYAGGSFGRRANTQGPTTCSRRRRSSRPSAAARRSSWSGCARTTCAAATTGRCSTTRWKPRSTPRAARRLAPPPGRPVHPARARPSKAWSRTASTLSVEGAANLPYAIPNLRSTCTRRRRHRRAGAVVALGRLVAHRLFDRSFPRRGGQGAAGKDPVACAWNCWPNIRAMPPC